MKKYVITAFVKGQRFDSCIIEATTAASAKKKAKDTLKIREIPHDMKAIRVA